ncbi:MAG: S26 family signal peptidase [Bacteroidota bacterium]
MSIPSIILILTLISHFVCLPKIFAKAGKPSWHGFIPFLNFYTWQKITNRPWWWILILIVPGIQFLMLIIMHVQMAWSFNRRSTSDLLMAIFIPFVLMYQLGFKEENKFVGNIDWKDRPRNNLHEWSDAILFALIAAFIIRTFVFEAFTIPTPSMEKSMRVGDFLFVSKLSHGAKMPETPISFPLAHHTIPLINTKSYLEWMKLDYFRLPGWRNWERNDPMVFNFPEGDTVRLSEQNSTYYQLRRLEAFTKWPKKSQFANQEIGTYDYAQMAIEFNKDRPELEKRILKNDLRKNNIVVRPIDKKDNYVKRCVALPGQKFEIRDKKVYINDELTEDPTGLQYEYDLVFSKRVGFEEIKEAINNSFLGERIENKLGNKKVEQYRLALNSESLEFFKKSAYFKSISPVISLDDNPYLPLTMFPRNMQFWDKNRWNMDDFGPITMPSRNATIEIDLENLPIYRRIIEVYEENELKVRDGKIYINGEESSTYTFEMDYYWLMGDNRHQSLDSRYWGFVPEDHVVGKPTFIWLSLDEDLGLFDGKIRWKRMFKGVD